MTEPSSFNRISMPLCPARGPGIRPTGLLRGLFCLALLIAACDPTGDDPDPGEDNHPPQVTRISASPSVEVLPGESIDLEAEVVDPDGDAVTLTWSALAGTFSDPASPATLFTAPERLGPLELTLSLEDARGGQTEFSLVAVIGYQEKPDADADGFTWAEGDCNDFDASIAPGAPELVDEKDNDCNGLVDEGSFVSDDDGDRWSELDGDCEDADPTVFPTNPEKIDGRDNDCDGAIDEDTAISDDDGDGVSEDEGDCNDFRSDVLPGADEAADGQDNDCDGSIDEGTLLGDDDGDGVSEAAGDCDDEDASTWPGADELDDGLDNDCDGLADDGSPGTDDDGDGFSEDRGDCRDEDPLISPVAQEIADGRDNDCDGAVDEGTVRGDDDGDGLAEVEGDCDDTDAEVHTGAVEIADDLDNDCDGLVDEQTDAYDNDGDGVSAADGDCDDTNPMIRPGATEAADGLDNDCDDEIDEGTVRYDDDRDGLSELQGDCDDADPTVYPGAMEIQDGKDNNCDGIGDPNQRPVAVASAVSPGTTCEEVALDGSASYDPDGDTLRYYYWFVIATPSGSLADDTWIVDGASSHASFVTDLPGDYTLGLIVSDGASSSSVTQTSFTVSDRGFNDDPVAEAGDDQARTQTVTCPFNGISYVCPACPSWKITLDGRKSTDPDGDRLFYTWSISGATTSAYLLTGATSATPTLELSAPTAEYGRSNTHSLFLKLEVRDCQGERDVDTVLVSYTCTGQ